MVLFFYALWLVRSSCLVSLDAYFKEELGGKFESLNFFFGSSTCCHLRSLKMNIVCLLTRGKIQDRSSSCMRSNKYLKTDAGKTPGWWSRARWGSAWLFRPVTSAASVTSFYIHQTAWIMHINLIFTCVCGTPVICSYFLSPLWCMILICSPLQRLHLQDSKVTI